MYYFLSQGFPTVRMRKGRGKAKARGRTEKRATAQPRSTLCTPSSPVATRQLTTPLRIPAPPPTWAIAFTVTASTWRGCKSRCACEYKPGSCLSQVEPYSNYSGVSFIGSLVRLSWFCRCMKGYDGERCGIQTLESFTPNEQHYNTELVQTVLVVIAVVLSVISCCAVLLMACAQWVTQHTCLSEGCSQRGSFYVHFMTSIASSSFPLTFL